MKREQCYCQINCFICFVYKLCDVIKESHISHGEEGGQLSTTFMNQVAVFASPPNSGLRVNKRNSCFKLHMSSIFRGVHG